ncbi:tyrosine-protein kinase receptor torso [Eurosta solidaginis]|uniref:tyrosine-protein kinase receptor torso n=1 Tax=Eurosta solidaginis TaxID=178769 RepID=UPI003530E422
MFWKLLLMKLIPFLLLSLLPPVTLQKSTSVIEAGAPFKSVLKPAEITKVVTNVTLYERGDIIQFLISWDDNMPKDTSYNIVITVLNGTRCSELPCSVYGIMKKSEQIIIPENPMAHVDQKDCGFIYGCNYSVKVETANASVAGYGTVSVPYCVMGLCSCQHAEYLPKVISSLSIPNNKTIIFNWSIKYQKRMDLINYPTNVTSSNWKLCVIISEQTNPLLSWGGKLIPITERLYPLQNVSDTNNKGTMQGTIKIRSPREFVAKAVLKLRSYIIDDLNCGGPEQFTKVTVPEFFGAQGNSKSTDFNLVIVLIVLSALFPCLIPLVIIYCSWKRKQKIEVQDNALQQQMKYVSQFSRSFEMEDNINYVDKYIEEAQAKCHADFYEIPHTKIHIGPEIGEGAFGRVYKAIAENLGQVQGNTVVAVKQLKNNPTADEVAEFLSEIEMLKTVGSHKNIVSFLGCCTIRAPYLIIMEFVGRGDLLTYLRTVRLDASNIKINGKINSPNSKQVQMKGKVKYIELRMSSQSIESRSDINHHPKSSVAETTYTIIDNEVSNEPFEYILDHKELYNFALQIVNGMRFLEEQKITHRDLAARNILIDSNKTLKVSDFGLSRHGIYTNTKTRKLTYLRTVRLDASNIKINGKINSPNSKQVQMKGKVKYIELRMSSQSIESRSDINHHPKSSVAETTYTIIDNEVSNEPFEYILDHKELYNFALQIVNGMRFLEEQKITHRDLAARNILIDSNKTLKVSDFGLSRHGIYTNTKTRKLPLRWLSIEAIRDNIYSNKSDVWAYGVVLWEIGTLGTSPYPTIGNHELIPYLLSGKRLEKPDICTNQLYNIMLQCWDENVEGRPTFVELYKILSPSAAYVDINSLSNDYVFPPIK